MCKYDKMMYLPDDCTAQTRGKKAKEEKSPKRFRVHGQPDVFLISMT